MALLEAGADLLRDCSFDELAVGDVCRRVKVTIGAFYGRFESKDAFFVALMSVAARRCLTALDEAVANDDRSHAELEKVCRDLVTVVTDVIRSNEAVLRAAMQYKVVQPARWTTVRETGSAIVERSLPLLLARMGPGRKAAKTQTIAFAFQMVFGTLLTAVQNRPKQVALYDQEMIDRLALAMFLQLDYEAKGGRRAK